MTSASTGSSGDRFPKSRDPRPDARLVVLGLGSNVRGKERINEAIDRIQYSYDLLVKSTRYVGPAEGGPNDQSETPALVGAKDADRADLTIYSNAAVLVRTADTFQEIRKELRRIEDELGRSRTNDHRVDIDIDILLIQGEVVRNRAGVTVVPHPDLRTKRHAALPSAEVAPALVHPETKERIVEIAARLA